MPEPLDVIAIGTQPVASKHGQRCPVWTHKRPLSECDCWIKAQVYDRAGRALKALSDAGYQVVAALTEQPKGQPEG